MNPKYRDALIAALEVPPDEGGYTKGKGHLVREGTICNPHDKFCCLGVACDIFGLWEVDGYMQGGNITYAQRTAIGMSRAEQATLTRFNDDYDTFGPVIKALRGM
jgi:hypothetical protein